MARECRLIFYYNACYHATGNLGCILEIERRRIEVLNVYWSLGRICQAWHLLSWRSPNAIRDAKRKLEIIQYKRHRYS